VIGITLASRALTSMSLLSSQAGVLIVGLGVLASGHAPAAQNRVQTPFQVVSLWSDEMLAYLTGEKQAACSGPHASKCERLYSGTCNALTFAASREVSLKEQIRLYEAERAALAQPVRLQVWGVGAQLAGVDVHHVHTAEDFAAMKLALNCVFTDNEQRCPAGRFQVGVVEHVEIRDPSDGKTIDLTPYADVSSDGVIVFKFDESASASLFKSAPPLYQLRVTAECFSVVPTPIEWTFPLHAGPDASAPSMGTLVSRVIAGKGQELIYRSNDGRDTAFRPDWIEEDWGYTYLMELTMLDRKGDWVQLPPRPFPQAVWVRIPDAKVSTLEPLTIYSLRKPVRARRKDTRRFETLTGNVMMLTVAGRIVEVRREHPSDMDCGRNIGRPSQPPPVYLLDAELLYDADLHLLASPAHTRGC
jgi:hypothetical protein